MRAAVDRLGDAHDAVRHDLDDGPLHHIAEAVDHADTVTLDAGTIPDAARPDRRPGAFGLARRGDVGCG